MIFTSPQNKSEPTIHMLEKFRSMVAEYAGLILSDAKDQDLLALVRGALPRPEAGIEEMDIILCRNVFIYFNVDTIARLMEKFASVLHPGGYLLTGHAEVTKYPKHLLKGVPYPHSMVYERCDPAVDFEPETVFPTRREPIPRNTDSSI